MTANAQESGATPNCHIALECIVVTATTAPQKHTRHPPCSLAYLYCQLNFSKGADNCSSRPCSSTRSPGLITAEVGPAPTAATPARTVGLHDTAAAITQARPVGTAAAHRWFPGPLCLVYAVLLHSTRSQACLQIHHKHSTFIHNSDLPRRQTVLTGGQHSDKAYVAHPASMF
jgi:hypothetical protein